MVEDSWNNPIIILAGLDSCGTKEVGAYTTDTVWRVDSLPVLYKGQAFSDRTPGRGDRKKVKITERN
jgi:hypothetical protein